jgi:hypothetical protein
MRCSWDAQTRPSKINYAVYHRNKIENEIGVGIFLFDFTNVFNSSLQCACTLSRFLVFIKPKAGRRGICMYSIYSLNKRHAGVKLEVYGFSCNLVMLLIGLHFFKVKKHRPFFSGMQCRIYRTVNFKLILIGLTCLEWPLAFCTCIPHTCHSPCSPSA